MTVSVFPRLGSTWPPKAWVWDLPLQVWTTPSLDGLSGARPGASAHFPLGALPIKPLLTREFRTACRITFVCSSDRGSCICADLVPVSCLSLSCLSLLVSFSSWGPGTGEHTLCPLVPSLAGDVPRGCSPALPCAGPTRLRGAVLHRPPVALCVRGRRIDGTGPVKQLNNALCPVPAVPWELLSMEQAWSSPTSIRRWQAWIPSRYRVTCLLPLLSWMKRF